MKEDYDKILKQNVNFHGVEKQKQKAIEEMSELIQALCKNTNISEEIADVQILLDQLKIAYPGWEEWHTAKYITLKYNLEKKC